MSFSSIPYQDIISFLKLYNQAISSSKKQTYIDAWNFITKNDEQLITPVPIADFIVAYNLSIQGILLDEWSSFRIIKSSDNDLMNLADSLTLIRVDKERIIRILGFLNKLDNNWSLFDLLPKEIFIIIFKYLDIKTLELLGRISKKFNIFFGSDEYESILKLKLHDETGFELINYSRRQLKFLYCSNKQKYLYPADVNGYVVNKEGQVFSIDKPSNPITELQNIIQIFSTELLSLFLDKYGKIIFIAGVGVNSLLELIPNVNNITKILDQSTALDDQGNICYFHYDNGEKMVVPNTNNIAQYKYKILDSKGNIYESITDLNIFRGSYLYDPISNLHGPLELLFLGYNIIQIEQFTLLDNTGNVYFISSNEKFSCGGDLIEDLELIPGLNNIIQISEGKDFGLALTNKGSIYYYLFLNNFESVSEIKLLGELNNIIEIAAKHDQFLALDAEGKVHRFIRNKESFLKIGVLDINLF